MDDPRGAAIIAAVVVDEAVVDPPIVAGAGDAGAEAAAPPEANGPPDDAVAAPPGPEDQGGEGGGAEGPDEDENYGYRGLNGIAAAFADPRHIYELFLDDDDDDNIVLFPQFVTMLGQQREGGRVIQTIHFRLNWNRLPIGDVERLFRDVLPYHPTLQCININVNHLPARVLRLLTEAPPSDNGNLFLPDLFIDGVLNQGKFQAIINVLNQNVALSDLYLGETLGANRCQLICQALSRNTNLRYLRLNGEILAGTLDGVATSSLQNLSVRGSFSDDAVPSLARELRANETLQYLYFESRSNGPDDAPALLELVGTYNFTLRTIHGPWGSVLGSEPVRAEIAGHMRRNARIRDALLKLQESGVDLHEVLLPHVLDLVRSHPTAMFRVLHTNVGTTFNEILLELAARRRQLAQEDQERRVRRRL